MSPNAQNPSDTGSGGGSVAIRGFLVQTLVALLELVQADPPVEEITLEPFDAGNEQFDYLWKDRAGAHAVQVKSTINVFAKSDVEEWAGKMEAKRSTEQCSLMLVGAIPSGLKPGSKVGNVTLRNKSLDLPGLLDEAATKLAKFLEAEHRNAGTAIQREMVVHALTSKLEHHSTESRTLTRQAFIKLLCQWVVEAPKGEVKIDLSHFDVSKYAPAELLGREAETAILDDAWLQAVRDENKRPHILTFVALGGEGKTSLVAKWAAGLAHQDWPGCEAVFAWSFYSQGTREQAAVSSELFMNEALAFFGDAAMAGSAAGAFDKGRRLAQLVGERRALLILDGLEPLQYAPTSPTPGELKDQGLAALLKALAANNQGLCIVTTRYALPDLQVFKGGAVNEIQLKRLSREAGVHLLKKHGVTGSDRQNLPLKDGDEKSEKVSEFEKLVEDVDGHALTLHIMGSFLKKAHQGDIRRRDRVTFAKASLQTDNGHAFRAMAAYAQWMEDGSDEAKRELAILRLMGLFDRPATSECISELMKAPAIPGLTEPLVGLPEEDWNCSLDSLEVAKLLTVNRGAADNPQSAIRNPQSFDAHPLLREYFAMRLRETQPDAWQAAHRRLYEHLCATTPDKPQPTLGDLQPLYQAVAHGCQAGLQQEACAKVYRDRILRGNEGYSTHRLGAPGSDLGAVACFFETPWSRISPALTEDVRGWLLNEAATRLQALGRLTEALDPIRIGLPISLKREDWKNAAIGTCNLSALELTLGDVAGAVKDAEQSVTYPDRTGDAFWKICTRTTHADALHQAGRRAEALERFGQAEKMQADYDSHHPLLYKVSGFQYCDLLLAAAERQAWQTSMECGGRVQRSLGEVPARRDTAALASTTPDRDPSIAPSPLRSAGALQICLEVSQRGEQTLEWAEQAREASFLDFALHHLTLGRAALYAAILEPSAVPMYIGTPPQRPSDEAAAEEFATPTGLNAALQPAADQIELAVSDLRRANQQDHLPRGLLTRAWLRSIIGPRTGPESAQSDLDEAWEIAERGPMPLFMADIHLHRARLFGVVSGQLAVDSGQLTVDSGQEYPWGSPQADLAEARRLIEKHGYGRRKEELDDVEQALRL